MTHYLNEIDPYAAAWLRNLMAADLIPTGVVDERSIRDVPAIDVRGPGQRHFFAGVAGWCEALRLAGWPESRSVFTGSCPCQPYSSAGKGQGDADARNLWPEFFRIIGECRPDTVFGEQVASAIGHGWLDGVCRDLEGQGYAVGHCVLGAHSAGAPHVRQRLYWVASKLADPERDGRQGGIDAVAGQGAAGGGLRPADGGGVPDGREGLEHPAGDGRQPRRAGPDGRGVAGGCGFGELADANRAGVRGDGPGSTDGASGGSGVAARQQRFRADAGAGDGGAGGLADPQDDGAPDDCRAGKPDAQRHGATFGVADSEVSGGWPFSGAVRRSATAGVRSPEGQDERRACQCAGRACDCQPVGDFWAAFGLVSCTDGNSRRVEPGSFPLAHGVPRKLGPLLAALERMGVDSGLAQRVTRHAGSRLAKAGRNRVGRLRGYGNAICPQTAAMFVRAFLDSESVGAA